MSVAVYTSVGDVFSVGLVSMSDALGRRVRAMTDSCPYVLPPQSCMNCETRVLMYVPGVREHYELSGHVPDEFMDTIAHFRDIPAMVFYTVSDGVDAVEVFVGGCAAAEHYTKILLYVLTTESPQAVVWVALPPALPFFDGLVMYLVNEKFGGARLVDATYLDEPLEHAAVALTLDKTDPMAAPDQAFVAMGLRDKAAHSGRVCRFRVVVPAHVLEYLRTYLDRPVEYGGALIVKAYTLVPHEGALVPEATLGFPLATETGGQFENVTPPISLFNFHTHPEHCYIKYGCALGWPSDGDMSAVMYMYERGNIVHFLVSVEGVYAIQLTPDFGAYLDTMLAADFINYEECRGQFGHAVKDFFAPFNSKRVETSPTLLAEYMDRINAVTIDEVVASAGDSPCHWLVPNYSFKIYNVEYKAWEAISRDGGFTVMAENAHKSRPCPPSIGAETHMIDSNILI